MVAKLRFPLHKPEIHLGLPFERSKFDFSNGRNPEFFEEEKMKNFKPVSMMFDLGIKLESLAPGTWKVESEGRVFYIAFSFALSGKKPPRFLVVGRTAYLLLGVRPEEKKAVWSPFPIEEVRAQIQTFEIELMGNQSFGELLEHLEKKNTMVFCSREESN